MIPLEGRGFESHLLRQAKYLPSLGGVFVCESVIIELKKIYNCSYDDFFEGLDIVI